MFVLARQNACYRARYHESCRVHRTRKTSRKTLINKRAFTPNDVPVSFFFCIRTLILILLHVSKAQILPPSINNIAMRAYVTTGVCFIVPDYRQVWQWNTVWDDQHHLHRAYACVVVEASHLCCQTLDQLRCVAYAASCMYY